MGGLFVGVLVDCWLIGLLVGWLVDCWLICLLVGLLVAWLVGWFDWLVGWLVCSFDG